MIINSCFFGYGIYRTYNIINHYNSVEFKLQMKCLTKCYDNYAKINPKRKKEKNVNFVLWEAQWLWLIK